MQPDVETLIRWTLAEDDAADDISGRLSLVDGQRARATVVAKQDGVISGERLVETACSIVGGLRCRFLIGDGTFIHRGDAVADIEGDGKALLAVERTALNLLGRMSAVATTTRRYVDAASMTPTIIKDTRKTTPLWRAWERAAVVDGGGVNHRDTLASMVMFKENHLRCAGGITNASRRARDADVNVFEVEVTDHDELLEALDARAPRIMLDNFSLDETRRAVLTVRERSPDTILEASGNMTLERIPDVAATGVDEISVGALTHSAPIFDFSLLVDWG